MDEATLLAHLTAAEQSLYPSLLNGEFGERLRLEQESISFASTAAWREAGGFRPVSA